MKDISLDTFTTYLLEGECLASKKEAERLMGIGVKVERLVREGIEAAAATLDEKCTTVQFNLLEIMLFGRAVTELMKFLYPSDSIPKTNKGIVVIATMEGDVHDLGKNITKMVLTCKGYRVIDCGKNCSINHLIDITSKENPVAVGISGLISSVVPIVKQVRTALDNNGQGHVRLFAGGAALKQLTSNQLNVDYVAETAFDSVRYLEQMVGGLLHE